MAHFRPMGIDSVAYHQDNVLGREDDHPGQALDYYGSRGETPLRWAGSGAERLGLAGEVTPQAYEALFGEGGPRDPLGGRPLVSAKRPGYELVVDTHKSVAVLGVIGRADDMHSILDAETQGTMAFLEGWFRQRGGRRGRDQRRTPTGGLTYAVTRHATSRAGDPQPHDHVPIANVVEMHDTRGGFKALDSAALRDLAGAAEMIGRLHGAARAVELGYRIERDDGDSGRKRAWRIVGIPTEVCGRYSKRRDQIDEFVATRGYDTPKARRIAALRTRAVKRHTSVDDELLPRWRAELAEIGWSVERLAAALDAARSTPGHTLDGSSDRSLAGASGLAAPLTPAKIDVLAAELFDPQGEFLRRGKVFTRSRLIEEVAPALYGHDPAELEPVLDRVLDSREVVPLIGVAGAREQTYATATVLANETRIAQTVERLATESYPTLTARSVERAVAAKQRETGHRFTAGQHHAAHAIARSGRRVNVVVGVAGSGKTTMLDAVTTALEDAGHTVIGTSTSGQATRTLAEETGVEANTVAKLVWRLDRGDLTLDPDTVVVLDEAGMTADADLLRLVTGVERAGGKLVLVGDPRQLAAIGPGGALGAVIERHSDIVSVIGENVRQRDPGERAALAQLRHGDPEAAVGWYAKHGRAMVASSRLEALAGMVDAWAADVDAGTDAVMLAWRRATVDDLNRLARHRRRHTGHLTGPDMPAPGDRSYAVGDRVVMTAPNNPKGLVTSERATVTAVRPHEVALTLRTDAGRAVTLTGAEIDQEHLDWGYAVTVHRTQAATVDRAHVFADGGGRQLGYVAMSRSRHHTTIHAVADNLDQALDDLTTDWSADRQQHWLTDTTTPGSDPRPAPVDPAARAAYLRVELQELRQAGPPDVTEQRAEVAARLDRLITARRDLEGGVGPWADTPVGRVASRYQEVRRDHNQARFHASDERLGWRERRRWARTGGRLAELAASARDDWHRHVEPRTERLDQQIDDTRGELSSLDRAHTRRRLWMEDHPDHARRIAAIDRELLRIEHPDDARLLDQLDHVRHQPPAPANGLGLGL